MEGEGLKHKPGAAAHRHHLPYGKYVILHKFRVIVGLSGGPGAGPLMTGPSLLPGQAPQLQELQKSSCEDRVGGREDLSLQLGLFLGPK